MAASHVVGRKWRLPFHRNACHSAKSSWYPLPRHSPRATTSSPAAAQLRPRPPPLPPAFLLGQGPVPHRPDHAGSGCQAFVLRLHRCTSARRSWLGALPLHACMHAVCGLWWYGGCAARAPGAWAAPGPGPGLEVPHPRVLGEGHVGQVRLVRLQLHVSVRGWNREGAAAAKLRFDATEAQSSAEPIGVCGRPRRVPLAGDEGLGAWDLSRRPLTTTLDGRPTTHKHSRPPLLFTYPPAPPRASQPAATLPPTSSTYTTAMPAERHVSSSAFAAGRHACTPGRAGSVLG